MSRKSFFGAREHLAALQLSRGRVCAEAHAFRTLHTLGLTDHSKMVLLERSQDDCQFYTSGMG